MKILIATGGTGGHINPALAVAGELRSRDKTNEILFVGTKIKMEARLVPAAGFDFTAIDMSGFKRGFSPADIKENLLTVKRTLKASRAAEKIIRDFKPDIVVGFGGYVSGPVVRMAAKLGVPTAIHEQNAYPGVTNKALAKKVDRVMLTVADAAPRIVCKNEPIVTGMPVRGEFFGTNRDVSRAELGAGELPLVLSMGGSLGARAMNEAMCGVIAQKHGDGTCTFIHAYGQYGKWVPEKLTELGVPENAPGVHIREYIDDMARCMSACDIVIGRAGASSLCEIEAMGRPSILIPSPNVAENHQYYNAMSLVNNNAAVIIEEKDLTPERLVKELDRLLNDAALRESMGQNARAMANMRAKEQIADIITQTAGK